VRVARGVAPTYEREQLRPDRANVRRSEPAEGRVRRVPGERGPAQLARERVELSACADPAQVRVQPREAGEAADFLQLRPHHPVVPQLAAFLRNLDRDPADVPLAIAGV